MLLSARFAAHTYSTPANTTVIATIRIVAMTGLTASSFLVSFFIFLSSNPVAGGISSTDCDLYSLGADESLILGQKPRYCALNSDVIFLPPQWSILFVNQKITNR